MTIFETVQYFGHSAIFLQATDYVVAIDPWLKGNPSCPQSFIEPKKIDLIILTHGHSDHAGDAVRLAKLTGASVLATFELATHLAAAGVSAGKVIYMNKGGTTHVGPVKVTLTHAFHSSTFDSASGALPAGEPCGVVVKDAKRAFFHSGDTALFSDLKLIAEEYQPEIGFLCCGDVFTMGQKEAAKAAQFLGLRRAVPIHYRTFPQLEQQADTFASECKKRAIEPVLLEPGQQWKIG